MQTWEGNWEEGSRGHLTSKRIPSWDKLPTTSQLLVEKVTSIGEGVAEGVREVEIEVEVEVEIEVEGEREGERESISRPTTIAAASVSPVPTATTAVVVAPTDSFGQEEEEEEEVNEVEIERGREDSGRKSGRTFTSSFTTSSLVLGE